MEQMAAVKEPDAPGHADERLGDASCLLSYFLRFVRIGP